MRTIAINEIGATPAAMNLPDPEPGPAQSRVKIIAAGLNPLDWKIADGALKDSVPYTFPLVLGVDGAGVVDAAGPDARFGVGEQVFGRFFGVSRGVGTYAEYAIATEDDAVIPIPEGMLYTKAAALPTAGMTALKVVEEAGVGQAGVEDGKSVLIVGATGGVGRPAVRLAASRGATVIATARPNSAAAMRELGAAETIDHGRGDLREQVRAVRRDGVDAIIDLVSDRTAAERLAALLRPGGVYVSTVWAVNPDALEAQEIRGVNLDYTPTTDLLQRAVELVEAGDMRIEVEEEIPLKEAPAALTRSRTGTSSGKTVIRL
ncbi:NADP-dependent oxidoreductase [Actinomadura sp. 9N407]|uniref:NADP-dependent oxidoreductase n=1 Tax=Actinomadura sp. 9N407 TaxID=3375154 RepID=UPI0037B3E000